MNLRTTHTFATLEINRKIFSEIFNKLHAAGYYNNLIDSNTIDMNGIALVPKPKKKKK